MRRHFFIFLFFAAVLGLSTFIFGVMPRASISQTEALAVGNAVFRVELAKTPVQQMRGLSGHAPLKANEGMLFVFPQKSVQGFWMKDMLFPIDIIWIADGRVVFIERNLPPDDSPNRPIYYPNQAVDMVLEVPAGTAERFGITIGDAVERRAE